MQQPMRRARLMAIIEQSARQTFIRAQTKRLAPPHCPEIRLHLADDAVDLWRLTEEELGEIGLPPPFWAFAWAGGQALARYILDHPETVTGRRVLDFAAGSGLVAIAAAKAGAAQVRAVDIDAFAVEAIALNAALNNVHITIDAHDIIGARTVVEDVILAGDICYEQPLARAVTDWLQALHAAGRTVLIGDPGRAYLPKDQLCVIAEYEVPVLRALEDAEVKRTKVWRFA